MASRISDKRPTGLSKAVDLVKDVVGYGDSPIDQQLYVGHIEDEIGRTQNSIAIQMVRQRCKDIQLDTFEPILQHIYVAPQGEDRIDADD